MAHGSAPWFHDMVTVPAPGSWLPPPPVSPCLADQCRVWPAPTVGAMLSAFETVSTTTSPTALPTSTEGVLSVPFAETKPVSGALAPYLDTTIEIGTGGSFGDCTGFTPTSTLYTGTLDNYSTTHTSWATGLAAFTAAVNPTAQTFRFTVDVQNDPAAQSLTANADFTWEAQD